MLMMGHCRSCEIISAKLTLRLGIETLPVNIEIGGGGGISLNILMKPQFLVAKLFPSTVADDTPKASKQLREDLSFMSSAFLVTTLCLLLVQEENSLLVQEEGLSVQCMQRNIQGVPDELQSHQSRNRIKTYQIRSLGASTVGGFFPMKPWLPALVRY
jgi:hypothetical protein